MFTPDFERPIIGHLLTVGGVILALFAVARIMSERRQPSNTMAWLLAIVLIPYVGVPLYILLGGRKVRRFLARKALFRPATPQDLVSARIAADSPTALTAIACGAAPPVGGNEVELITNGEDAFAAFEKHIKAAKHSISITTFILARDDTGRRLVHLLALRASEGVRVRLLLDAVGSMFSSRGFTDPIRDAGGEVRRFMPVIPFFSRTSMNLRNHRKIAIFDHTTAIIGGHNLAREYMGPTPLRKRWSDFGAVICGPAVSLLNEVFLTDWSFASGRDLDELRKEANPVAPKAGSSEVQVVGSGPDVAGDALYEAIISMIQEADRSITIVTPYFIPDEVLLRSLMVKARAGRTVTLILPARSNHPLTDFARKHYVRELQRAGANVLLYGPNMMHSKAIIVDDRIGLISSANFDLRSLFVNFEVGVLVYSPAEVRAMTAWAGGLAEHSKKPRAERRRKYRIIGNLAEEVSRLLAPLL